MSRHYKSSTMCSKSSEIGSEIENKAPPFCSCYIPRRDLRLATNKFSTINCTCGEDKGMFAWSWEKPEPVPENPENHCIFQPETYIDGNSILFHPVYSQGTSVIRSNQELKPGMQHYWEIKILSCLSGTDIMIGVGTDLVDLNSHQYKFSSFLGQDEQSWGFSYRGLVQHEGRLKYYGKKYSQGCIVGVYLDLFRGTLEFYLNRRPQGKAYTNLPINKGQKFYAMACSTSAKSSIRLINSQLFESNLQFLCMKTISRYPSLINSLKTVPGLRHLCDELFFLQSKEQYEFNNDFTKNNLLLLEDEAVISSKKLKLIDKESNEEMDDSSDDLYKDAHMIKHFKCTTATSSDDDDEQFYYYTPFCEHY